VKNESAMKAQREIARGLGDVLEPVLRERASAFEMYAARQVAQLIGLPGLDALLAALEPGADRPWTREALIALGRLRRERARCDAEGDVEIFRQVDAELGSLASELRDVSAQPPARSAAVDSETGTLSVAEALTDVAIVMPRGETQPGEARVSSPVAAALRAALDWLAGEPARPFEISLGDGVLDIAVTVRDASSLHAAHAVLAATGGSCGPWLAEHQALGTWLVRVPLAVSRAPYLMIEQGELKLALPWSAVLRIAMLPAASLETRAEAMWPDVPAIAPLSPLQGRHGERPVIVIASGLKRARMAADRLIWRLAADDCAPSEPAPAGVSRAVRTEDGAVHWIADPASLLESVPLPIAALPPPPVDAIQAPVVRVTAPPPVAPTAAPRAQERPAQRFPEPPALRVLARDHVVALPLASGPVSRATSSERPAELDESRPAPRPAVPEIDDIMADAPPLRPRALIIEDSITARVFLSRMLEVRGFDVRTVPNGTEGLRELARGGWTLICADIELPDAGGVEWLRLLQEKTRGGSAIAVLVRDRHDREVAGATGLTRTLRKPFDVAEVAALVTRVLAHSGPKP
jgi:CheY-like chemotaxis protein